MPDNQPALLRGIYTQAYNEIVRPDRVWTVSKYFLRRWTPYLTPAAVWLVIGARQLSYRNRKRPWFVAYDGTLADAAGLNVDVFRRTLKKAIADDADPIAHFLTKEADGAYITTGKTPRKDRTHYSIRLDDPLTPADAQSLAHWLRIHAPLEISPATVAEVLDEARRQPLKALHAGELIATSSENSRLRAVKDVVRQVFPSLVSEPGWMTAAERLHSHIVSADAIHLEPQYFREQWLPILGPGPALLLVYLRSFCFCNEETGERRDQVSTGNDELTAVLQTSARTLRRWFGRIDEETAHDTVFGPFLESLEQVKRADQKVVTTYQVNLLTPLIPSDLARYQTALAERASSVIEEATDKKSVTSEAVREGVPDRKSGAQAERQTKEADKKSVAGRDEGKGVADKRSATHEGAGQIVGNEEEGGGQIVGSSRTKSRPYKYYKHLLSALDLEALEQLEQSTEEQQQHQWHIHDELATEPFAVVVAENGLSTLLEKLGIHEPARSQVLAGSTTVEETVSWYLYALHNDGLREPISYLVTRLRAGDPAPAGFMELATLTWEQWRVFAAASYLKHDCPQLWDGCQDEPGFEEWETHYGDLSPSRLPFDVGGGLEELSAAVRLSSTVERVGEVEGETADPSDVALWQEVLDELALQMTRATFEAWLRGTQPIGRDGETLVVAVRSAAAAEWLENRLHRTILRTLQAISGEENSVQFSVDASEGNGIEDKQE